MKKNLGIIAILGTSLLIGGWIFPTFSIETPPTKGVPIANIDSTVNIHEDFYRFAVGKWMRNNPIPGTESSWGSFNEVSERNKVIIKQILEESAKADARPGSNQQKIGDFYKSGMDSIGRNTAGVKPLLPYLKEIDGLKDTKDLMRLLQRWQSQGRGILFHLYSTQDDKKSTDIIPSIWQGGLCLPDRDYYLKDNFANVREQYVAHIAKMLEYIGTESNQAEEEAKRILTLETQIAEISMSRVDMRDPYKLYNKLSLSEMNDVMQGMIDWKQFLQSAGAPEDAGAILVAQPSFLKRLTTIIQEQNMEIWKAYLKWHLLHDTAGQLSDNIGEENFDFFSRKLSGVKQRKPRWERVMASIEEGLGEALGELYVKKAFKPEAKARMLRMVGSLQNVFRERIEKLDWMSTETKKKAIEKLNKFTVKIGYPDKFRDYSALRIMPGSFFENNQNVQAFEYKRMMNKIGKPVDKTEWGMSPQTVNAYYNPGLNEIVFPAGILQPPFFDFEADDATIYGAIGAVIGHEMTHGFDDQGRQYDADGNLADWWTAEDAKKFEEKSQVVINQFNGYTVLDTIHVNGKLTTGENLADLGGLAIAYDAFKRTEQGKGTQKIEGLTPDQRFFISWANAWKNNTTPEAMKQQIMTDSHSPEEWRCNGPITHMQAFYDAFKIKEGTKMFRAKEKRVTIW